MTDGIAKTNEGLIPEQPDVVGTPEGDNEFAPDQPLGTADDAARERVEAHDLSQPGSIGAALPE